MMDGRLIVLHRAAEALGESGEIADFDTRKRFQKAIYLGQLAGVDLGYRYSWYIKGPYSTDLTRDYYAMSESIESGEGIPDEKNLKPQVVALLERVKGIFEVPDNVKLSKSDWMELLSSWHYLRKVSRLSGNDAQDFLKNRKTNLAPFIQYADKELVESGLL